MAPQRLNSGQTGQKLAQLAQVLPLQLIHPEGFDLLTDGPKHRRAFIDWESSTVNRVSMMLGVGKAPSINSVMHY